MAESFFDRVHKNDVLHSPDVLSCLANLSNDEVFTPPEVVNQILDMLPQELFSDPNTRFLDPACKTGVFLREIAKRLLMGLEPVIPDLQERIDHIFHNQLYGIAITELTSLLSRRSVYCSQYPNGQYSVSKFNNSEGNIRFKRIEHKWGKIITDINGKKRQYCTYCGTAKDGDLSDERGQNGLETHAYEWIHTNRAEEIFRMNFDVIISNPPYQLSDGGGDGSSATPIYHYFIQQAKKLNPRFLSMIIPARWYSGGKGLDGFRDEMLHDERLSVIHDFPETGDCFPGLNIRGGVCYFLWSKDHKGDCEVFNHKGNNVTKSIRPLLEKGAETFIRYNSAISILNKVKKFDEETMDSRVSSRLPFGIPSNFGDYKLKQTKEFCVGLRRSDRNPSSPRLVYIKEKDIKKNKDWKNRIKVLVSKASPGGDEYPHAIISKPVIAEENVVCTETYLIVDFVDNLSQAENLVSYMNSSFFRFMMALVKNTQNISKSVFSFVPIQDYNEKWDDQKLYEKYGISANEIAFIDSLIKPIGDE